MIAVDFALALLAIPVFIATGYLALLTLLSWRPRIPAYDQPSLRFDLVVPAHNEEAGIARTVQSLLAIDYPSALRRVVVVADNCTDQTAKVAAQAQATVLVRQNADQRGKGFALAHAFEHCLQENFADAVVVVDADSVVSANLLRAFAARLQAGAFAVQAHYGVSNPQASWRTRLMTIALALFHGVRSLGRERLRVSCGLRGNGMCFSTRLLREVPHDAFSIVEDVEYGIRLARAGYRVQYAYEAQVLGEMVSSPKAAVSQRQRWEQGRLALVRAHGWALFNDGLRRPDRLLMDMAMDLLVPPLTMVVAFSLLGSGAAAALAYFGRAQIATWIWFPTLAFLGLYVTRGWLLSDTGMRGVLDLLAAPAFMIWKLGLALRRKGQKKDEWVRTTRENEVRRG